MLGALLLGSRPGQRLLGRLRRPGRLDDDVPGIAHKAKLGLVTIGCRDGDEVRAAIASARRSLAGHAPGGAATILVEQLVAGSEVLVGLHRSPLGVFLTVGGGGTAAGAGTRASTFRLPEKPDVLRDAVAHAGGIPAGSTGVATATDALVALGGQFASGELDRYETVEVNPMIVSADACWFVDVLMVVR